MTPASTIGVTVARGCDAQEVRFAPTHPLET
jgi:hypothetical protein